MSLVFRWFSYPIYCSIAGFANAGGQKYWTYVLAVRPIIGTYNFKVKFCSPFIKLPDQFIKMKATEVYLYYHTNYWGFTYVVESDLQRQIVT